MDPQLKHLTLKGLCSNVQSLSCIRQYLARMWLIPDKLTYFVPLFQRYIREYIRPAIGVVYGQGNSNNTLRGVCVERLETMVLKLDEFEDLKG